MNRRRIVIAPFLLFLLLSGASLMAQNPLGRFGNFGNVGGGGQGADTLAHRKADTITLNFRFLDSSRLQKLDSSILDIGRKIPRPATWINLGNMGTPAKNLVFSPRMQSGWDPGWHSYDLYTFKVDETRFFNTTRPYTELGYMLAGRGEQFVNVFHTQNIRPNWNFSFEYRLINAPGTFQNQNTNHSNMRIGSWYQGKNKRYSNFFVLVSSKLAASENGGITNPANLDSIQYANQATLPVYLGNGLQQATGNLFSAPITTGTRYTSLSLMMRQQYDLGQKDSIITDTSVTPLFYPRVRLEHTFSYSSYRYRFFDFSTNPTYALDSSYYWNSYGLSILKPLNDTVFFQDKWSVVSNDFSIYQFPDSKNPQQFIKLGATLELLKGNFDTSLTSQTLPPGHATNTQNVFAHGEYRNKTRNQKWDIEAYGRLYLNGLNSGDYNAFISLKRLISRQVGYLEAGFENANRTPGFVFDRASAFYLDSSSSTKGIGKENTTHLFATLDRPQSQLTFTGSYYLMTNYAYFTSYYKVRQADVFNLLQLSVKKQFTLYRHWKWRTLTYLQQVAGSSPVHVPLLMSTNQVGYDGSLGFKNLNVSFGTELRYISPYKADGYAPVTGQFFSQDSTIRQKLPDISLYLHFRVRSFTAYIRGENINAMKFSPHGFGFYNNNFVAPGYASPGLIIRFGFFWGFVN
ncbi:MAG: hypothetical protein JST68_06485 [Bacteroidetes bacterium]|nr:hypothetical protein [Bacteroidota bacterium]